MPTGDVEKDYELQRLIQIVEQDRSHFQTEKQAINFFCLLCMIMLALVRDSSSGLLMKCSAFDWVCVISFAILMGVMIFVSVKLN